MYTSHRIPDSPGSPAPERPPAARRASESGGGRVNRLEVACFNCSRGQNQAGHLETPLRCRVDDEVDQGEGWPSGPFMGLDMYPF